MKPATLRPLAEASLQAESKEWKAVGPAFELVAE
jgi:hypothetical protein